MKRLVALLGFALFLLLPTSVAAAECQFVLGFMTIRDLIGHDIVGECLENEHHNEIGDSVQQTTGGLLVWRKADNWTAFTDGYRTWIIGPNGLVQRLNTERFEWEADYAPGGVAPPTPPAISESAPTPSTVTREQVRQAIAALPWVHYELAGQREIDAAEALEDLAVSSPEAFQQLLGKPWMQAESLRSLNVEYNLDALNLFYSIKSMTNRDEATALRIMQMPFMDAPRRGASIAWKTVKNIFISDPEGLQRLLAHPTLRNGITNEHFVTLPLLYLEPLDPHAAAAIRQLPWINDWPSGAEALGRLALAFPPTFWGLLERYHGGPIGHLVPEHFFDISQVDGAVALQIAQMPFLKTQEVSIYDYWTLSELHFIAMSDLDGLRRVLSHPSLHGGITDENKAIVPLLILEQLDPEATAAIKALPWLQDGITSRESQSNVWIPSDHELWQVFGLLQESRYNRQLFLAKLSKPWFRDGLDSNETRVVRSLDRISTFDRAASVALLRMPFLDSVDYDDSVIVDEIFQLAQVDRAGFQQLLSHPVVRNGIRDGQRSTVELLSLSIRNPQAAPFIAALPWIQDGIAPSETRAVTVMHWLGLASEQVLQVVTQKSWVRDGLSIDEIIAIDRLQSIASKNTDRRDEASALAIAQMPFLNTFEAIDAAAIDSLHHLHWEGDQGYLRQVLSHPALQNGISDNNNTRVAALTTVVRERPDLLNTLLDPAQASVEERLISLPRAGGVLLSIIRTNPATQRTMDIVEDALRAQEEFMLEAFPTKQFTLLIADGPGFGGGGGRSGVNAINAADGENADSIAGLVAGAYWSISSSNWIYGGGGQMLKSISLLEPSTVQNAPLRIRCNQANSISAVEKFEANYGNNGSTILCSYDLGFALFLDLYRSLGDEAFRQGFRNLHAKLRDYAHKDECKGSEEGVCYVKAAFVNDASLQDASIAELIINRWYYGSEYGPE